jgi:hypothetical protein
MGVQWARFNRNIKNQLHDAFDDKVPQFPDESEAPLLPRTHGRSKFVQWVFRMDDYFQQLDAQEKERKAAAKRKK